LHIPKKIDSTIIRLEKEELKLTPSAPIIGADVNVSLMRPKIKAKTSQMFEFQSRFHSFIYFGQLLL